MPRVREQEITGYAHCTNALCSGHRQRQVPAVRVETEFTYMEKGGDAPGVENSHVHFRFADESDSSCSGCDRHLELSDQPRKVYQPLSGHSPDGLLKYGPYDPSKQAANSEVDALRAEIEELKQLMRDKAAA